MKQLLTTSGLSLLGLLVAGGAPAFADCGEVTVASMNWNSAEVLASLDKIILEEGYGCSVGVISGDTVPTITSMVERGAPDIAPEGWLDVVPELLERGMDEGRLVKAAVAISDGAIQGWWVPKYIVDAHPDIKTIDDAFRHPELFPDPENPDKGGFHAGPQGWGSTLVTTQFYKAYGGDEAGFRFIDTGSAAGLDGSLARAHERNEGWIGYYWSPTAMLGRYEMVKLDHGVPFDEEEWKRCNTVGNCPDPQRNEWRAATVQTLMTSDFAERAGEDILDYLNKRSWTNATVNALLAWMADNQATGDDAAWHFLRNNEDIWVEWVSPEAAENIRSAL
ncbi:ABC transporter substrate-binding protein [Paracoccus sp. P2]